jgi:hypothetical protein
MYGDIDAVLFKSHCQVCKTGGYMNNIIPVDIDERIALRVGQLRYVRCTRYPVCKNQGWCYFDTDLEHSDAALFCDCRIWDRREVIEDWQWQ